ncbi:hypothetical protein MMC20_004828 [Loxospora ochrophaea]|nr:hypothetical protein [Loxospora ochrophaea]
MAESLPTVILVHGAWHTPPNYQDYISALQERGFTVHCPRLPSCSNASPPPASFLEDVTCVRGVVEPLVDAGRRVLMVMHSYGGTVGTDAVQGLDLSARKSESKPGGVVHLLYMCAFILPPGGSIYGVVKEAGFDHLWPAFVDNFDDGSTFPKDPGQLFFGADVDKEVVDKALPHMVRSPMSAFIVETQGTAWREVPATYISTQQDASVPRVYQDIMTEKVRKEGVVLRTEDYDTSHSIFVTRQEDMVGAVVRAAEDDRNLK